MPNTRKCIDIFALNQIKIDEKTKKSSQKIFFFDIFLKDGYTIKGNHKCVYYNVCIKNYMSSINKDMYIELIRDCKYEMIVYTELSIVRNDRYT